MFDTKHSYKFNAFDTTMRHCDFSDRQRANDLSSQYFVTNAAIQPPYYTLILNLFRVLSV